MKLKYFLKKVTQHLKDVRQEYYDLYSGIQFNAMYMDRKFKKSDVYFAVVTQIYRTTLASNICFLLGHKIECEGVATPDHGYENLYCIRCSYLEHIIYY